jgi:hypothetical protein
MQHIAFRSRSTMRAALVLCVMLLATLCAQAQEDPLPSWNNGPAKQAIISFVKDTTEKSSFKYVEPKDRIVTFDRDGTVWTEHPLYAQVMFALDRLGKLAPQHPERKDAQPFQAALEDDREAMSKFTEPDGLQIVAITHAGMSTEEFEVLVKQWLATAKAPRFARPYTDLVYLPRLEVMRYLRDK